MGGQARTPQAALEEIATTDKPDVLARHLPEPVQKSIEVLPNPQKQQVLDKLLSIKAEQFDGCTVRRAAGVDAWEIIDSKGESRGKIKLANAFISGLDALLSLRLESDDNAQMFIVTMHLEGDEWRIDNFGAWQNTDLGLPKLAHQPTQAEKNEAATQEALGTIRQALSRYANQFPEIGYPAHLQMLTTAANEEDSEERAGLLDASLADEPAIKNGYEFRYTLTRRGSLRYEGGSIPVIDRGAFRITATPVDFGKTGFRNYLATEGGVHATAEQREATEDDPVPEDPD